MNAALNVIKVRNLQVGDMLDGFDEVLALTPDANGAAVIVVSAQFPRRAYYGANEDVRIAQRKTNRAVFAAGPSREVLNHIPQTDTLIERVCYIHDMDMSIQYYANDL